MAITITKQPAIVDFAKNPIAFSVVSNRYLTSQGAKAFITLRRVSNPVVGSTLTLSSGRLNITFTFVTTPDDSGTELPATSDMLLLLQGFLSNYLLTKHYNVSILSFVNGDFAIQAKEFGTQGTLSTSLPASFTQIAGVAGLNRSVRPNFTIKARIMVEETVTGNDFREFATENLNATDSGESNLNGFTDFYPGEYLSTLFRRLLDLPTFNETTPQLCVNTLRRYYVLFAERYGFPTIERRMYTSDFLRVFNGLFDYKAWPTQNIAAAGNNFLINGPRTRELYYDSHSYLFWLTKSNINAGAIRLHVKWYMENGTDATDIKGELDPVANLRVYRFPTGASQLNLPENVYKWEVWLTDKDNVPFSEVFTFVKKLKPWNGLTLMFKNYYGVLESLCINGFTVADNNARGEVLEKFLPWNYTLPPDGQFEQVFVKKEISPSDFVSQTGYIDTAYSAHLKEFVNSERMFIQLDGRYQGIVMKPGTVQYLDTQEDEQNIEFQWQFDHLNDKI
jgi:hypothetical protein